MQNPDPAHTALVEEFAARLAAAGGQVLVNAGVPDIVATASAIPGSHEDGAAWISAAVENVVPQVGIRLREAGIPVSIPPSAEVVRDAPLGIALARLAIAETGSVLLHENDLAGRAVSLMTQHLIVLCPADALVASLDDAAPVLREIAANGPSYATFVTGPSRTADIERELAVGVQGPGSLTVIFLSGVPVDTASRDT
jgi:L-lactate dehydrogenase complex protein LldG